jgi:hypothetical protein
VATVAAAKAGPFQEFYDALVAKGIRPEMARLTLARKIAAITLIVWKSPESTERKARTILLHGVGWTSRKHPATGEVFFS